MKSPVSDLAPSDGEEGSDRTPLLQRAPRAETGEWRRDPGGFRAGGRPKVEGVQSRSSPRGLRSGSPVRAPPQASDFSDAQKPAAGPGRRAAPGGRGWAEVPAGPRQVQPRGSPQVQPAGSGSDLLGAAGAGRRAIFRSIELGTLWKNELGERTLK